MSREGARHVAFEALEYCDDDTFRPARYAFRDRPGGDWVVEREGREALQLDAGHRLLRTRVCGVCSTDLDRRFLPFPLPQITGHEAVVEDEIGRRFVVEINDSHRARGEPDCAFCAAGLDTHCPSRLVLGIHDLPGGFGPWLLAPTHALVRLPDDVPDETGALIEPFAAALQAVERVAPSAGSTIAVLGPRRLGMLCLAALAAHRRSTGIAFEIVALARRPELARLALAVGADRADAPPVSADEARPLADVVIDTTGSPDGLALAGALAQREVHLKSTHGQPALGCAHLTEAVVDELAIAAAPRTDEAAVAEALARIEPLCTRDRLRVGWLCTEAPDGAFTTDSIELVRGADAATLLGDLEAGRAGASPGGATTLPRVDVIVVDGPRDVDPAIRPVPGREASPLRPRGLLLVGSGSSEAHAEHALGRLLARGVVLSTSRCGDFHRAIDLIGRDAALRELGDRLVTQRFGAADLPRAFEAARSRDAVKVLVEHGAQGKLRSR